MPVVKKETAITVEEFTTPSPVVVKGHSTIAEVSEIMDFHNFRHIPVVDGSGAPIGLISDRDIKVVANFEDMKTLTAEDLMTPEPFVVGSDTPLDDVAIQMSRNKWGSAIVVFPDDDTLGIFTSTDALNALIELLQEREGTLMYSEEKAANL